ncbi:hypothetical protein ACKWTF_016025 [Chironomus riparius]
MIFFGNYDGSEWPEEEVIACALMNKKNEKYYFIHETFREFFVAEAIAKAIKKEKIDAKVMKVFDKIMSIEKFKIVRMVLFNHLNEEILLEHFRLKIKKLIFEKNHIFSEFFSGNHENITDYAIDVLKGKSYETAKDFIYKHSNFVINTTRSSKMFEKFQNFCFDIFKSNSKDFEDFIIKNEIFHKIIQSNLEIEVFQGFINKMVEKTSCEFVKKAMMTQTSFVFALQNNIFYSLSISSKLNAQKVQKFLKILEKFFTLDALFKLMSKTNAEGLNILQTCVWVGNVENLKILLTEIEFYFKEKKPQNLFEKLLMQYDKFGTQLTHTMANRNNIECHKAFWELLFKTFENREELKKFILSPNFIGNCIATEIIGRTTDPAIAKFTLNILKDNFKQQQLKEILFSKNSFNINFLQLAARPFEPVEFKTIMIKICKDICQPNDLNYEISFEIFLFELVNIIYTLIYKRKLIETKGKSLFYVIPSIILGLLIIFLILPYVSLVCLFRRFIILGKEKQFWLIVIEIIYLISLLFLNPFLLSVFIFLGYIAKCYGYVTEKIVYLDFNMLLFVSTVPLFHFCATKCLIVKGIKFCFSLLFS